MRCRVLFLFFFLRPCPCRPQCCEYIQHILRDLREHIRSVEFAETAREADAQRAFTMRRKLPLPALIAALLCQRN